jgi:hypothetical protein
VLTKGVKEHGTRMLISIVEEGNGKEQKQLACGGIFREESKETSTPGTASTRMPL